MKCIAIAALLFLSAPALSHGEDASDSETDASAARVEACLGQCEKDVNQTTPAEAPKVIKARYDQLMNPGAKDPNGKGAAVPEQQQDI